MEKPSFVWVLGTHRSRSSLVGGILARLNVYMGNGFKGAEEAGSGSYEDHVLVNVMEKAASFPRAARIEGSRQPFRDNFRAWLRNHRDVAERRGQIPGAKFPSLSLIDDLDLEVPGAKFILCERPFADSVESLGRLVAGRTVDKANDLEILTVQKAIKQGMEHIAGVVGPRAMRLDTEALLRDPVPTVNQIAAFLGIDPATTIGDCAAAHVHAGLSVVG